MMNQWWWPLVPLLCLWIDRRFGEPPTRWHPVAWMGLYLQWAGRRVAPASLGQSGRAGIRAVHADDGRADNADPDDAGLERNGGLSFTAVDQVCAPDAVLQPFLKGAAAWLAGAVVVWWLASVLQWLCLSLPASSGLPSWLTLPLMAFCLKPMLAWAMLRDEVYAVEAALQLSLPAGRERLGWLVSRNTQALSESDVREAAIETLAENLNDSVVAPLFWFALLGLPGAALYRFTNTADAMWGYPGERGGRQWQWAGKWAARADDVLSWAPARLTALLLMLGTGAVQWRRLRPEAVRTTSPNGGWPMAAMALRLGVRLGKPGVYVLNAGARVPDAADTRQAIRHAARSAWLAAAFAAVCL
ncbi:MAG: adenosylcobinamide-phosphate synthase CbiB [Lautropia sp.]|nr:adenosylcobinamide-phosphate synthase CbiB [Lautropia sp.]